MRDYDYQASIYGHFGQGCVHCRINFDLFTKAGIEKYRRFVDEMAHIVVKYEGSISGEHGDGQIAGAAAHYVRRRLGTRVLGIQNSL